jgi:hypothetical protein
MPLTDDITTSLLEIKTLQSEYGPAINAYNIAKQNYLNALQNNALNPCKSYSLSSTNVSQACYNKIWTDQKCTTSSAPVVNTTSTFQNLLDLAYGKSKSNVEADKILCYGSATSNIINTNSVPVSSARNSDFIPLSRKTWTGAAPSVTTAASQNVCIQNCAANVACTGATYNSGISTNNCSSVIGAGILTPDTSTPSTKTALIPQLTSYLLTLDTLNDALTTLINLIEGKLSEIQPNLDAENLKLLNTSVFETGFRSDYDMLVTEKANIVRLLAKYRDISAEYDEKTLFAEREHNSLRIWIIAAIIMFIFVLKYTLGLDSPGINTIFWATIFVLLGLSLSSPTGFIGLGVLFLIFLSFFIYN